MATPVLWQFRFSHFNEKVRWALDFKGIPHVRRSLVPGLHVPRVLWLSGQKSVPVLELDGETIVDSTRIIATLERVKPDPPLYPRNQPERALALEDFFDEQLGPYVRRALFHELLPDADYCAALLSAGSGPAARTVYRAAFPVIRLLMKMDMKINAAGAAGARARVAAALGRLEAELGSNGYLAGDGFSVADLTAAALLSPLVFPPEWPYPLPGPLPTRAAALCDAFAARPGMRWVREMYRRHRGTSTALAA